MSAKTLVLKPYELEGEGIRGSNMSWEINKKDYVLTIKVYALAVFGMKEINIDGSKYNYNNETEVPWHTYRNDLKGVTIEESVTKICNYAFISCKKITDIVIPSSVKDVGTSAFQNCATLKTVTFVTPPSISGKIKIRRNAFEPPAVIRYESDGAKMNYGTPI